MPSSRTIRPATVLLCVILIHGSTPWLVHADSAAVAPPAAMPSPSWAVLLESARDLIKDADYDSAIATLKPAVAVPDAPTDSLRDAYLLLIKTYVFIGNDNRFKPQGREVSSLNYQEARKRIAECLSIRELRHTRAEPDSEYPPEMITAFAEVRGQLFGSFRVVRLEPSNTTVRLDGEPLRANYHGKLGEMDLPIGPHHVVAEAPGCRRVTETITISPGAIAERPYVLTKKHGKMWYAVATAAVLGIVVGAVAASNGGSTPTETLSALPGPPPPPAR